MPMNFCTFTILIINIAIVGVRGWATAPQGNFVPWAWDREMCLVTLQYYTLCSCWYLCTV